MSKRPVIHVSTWLSPLISLQLVVGAMGSEPVSVRAKRVELGWRAKREPD